MYRILAILLFSGMTVVSRAELYKVFEENGKVGLKNETGQILLPASFEALGWSDGNFSLIGQVTGYKLGNNWGLINLKKEYITPAEYEGIFYGNGDRVIAQKKVGLTSRLGCLDLTGKITIPFKYDGIKIQGLRAVVFVKNGTRFQHGLVDLNDKEIIAFKFKSITAIGSLRYAVENFETKTALFSEQGIKLTEFAIDSISSFRKGKAVIYQNLKQGLIDREGEIKIEPRYREIKINEDATISARLFDEWKILDADNHELKKIEGDELRPLAKGLYAITVASKKGIIDEKLNFVIQPIYDHLSDFHHGKMIAKRNGKFGIIRKDESVVLPIGFDSLLWDGLFIRALENDFKTTGWNLYDTFGIKKTNHSYEQLGTYNGKFFPAENKGYQGAVNRYGEEFIHCVYDSILEFKEDQLVVKFQGQYGIISLNEDWLVMPQAHLLELVNQNLYLEKQPAMTFLKKTNGEIIYFTDNKFEIYEDHLLEFLPNGTEKTVSLNGLIINRTSIESVGNEKTFRTTEGLQGIKRDGLYGFVDSRGRLRIANRYEDIGEFKEGFAPVKIMGKWGFVDTQDNIVINPNYEKAEEFEQGLSIVRRNGKAGVIDKAGKAILTIRYDSVQRLTDQKFLIMADNKHGLADKSGNVLIEPRFDKLQYLSNNYVLVEQQGRFGLLTLEGLSTIPLVYDQLIYDQEKNQFLGLKKAEWIELK